MPENVKTDASHAEIRRSGLVGQIGESHGKTNSFESGMTLEVTRTLEKTAGKPI